jgi:hypothetical protein
LVIGDGGEWLKRGSDRAVIIVIVTITHRLQCDFNNHSIGDLLQSQ